MEDGLFPSSMSIFSDDPMDLEEERRLCYVGITRAKKELVLTSARQRMVNGDTRYCRPSRFLEEIPEEYLEEDRLEPVLGAGKEALGRIRWKERRICRKPALEQEQPEAVLEAKALEIVALEIADLKITVLIPPVFPGINRPPDLAHPLERHLRCRRLPVWITARETGSAI